MLDEEEVFKFQKQIIEAMVDRFAFTKRLQEIIREIDEDAYNRGYEEAQYNVGEWNTPL